MTKHSPPPWKWEDDHALVSNDERSLAIYYEPGRPTTEEDEANLRLVIAAPKLFEALKNLVQRVYAQERIEKTMDDYRTLERTEGTSYAALALITSIEEGR